MLVIPYGTILQRAGHCLLTVLTKMVYRRDAKMNASAALPDKGLWII